MKKIKTLLHKVWNAIASTHCSQRSFEKIEPVKSNLLFMDVVKEYVQKYIEENPLCEATKNRYEVYLKNTHLFLATHKMQNIALEDFKLKHAEQFRSWLRISLKTCSIRHASRHIELFKRVTKYAVLMEYIVNDHLMAAKCLKDKPKKIISLNTNEIRKMMAYNFQNDFFRVTADLFLFQCFTGLSYSDIYSCTIVERYERLYIEGDRTKTGEEYVIYFFPEAKDILQKYQYKLPRLSNQRYNEYLKEIAGLLNINKKLTTHVGRKTHATILSERGMTSKPISMHLGNTERVCNESYINKTHEIINNEVDKLGLSTGLLKSA